MKNFTIHDLELYSGVKAHTLRIWERRYSVTNPGRSAGNNRLYTLEDLKKILNLVLLKNSGYRISVLSKINAKELEYKIEKVAVDFLKWKKAINELTINMYSLQAEKFEKTLDDQLLSWPIDIFIENIIYPFLCTTGLMWKGNKYCEEHLAVTAIRRKLIWAFESIGAIAYNDKSVLLFLPDNKQLDLGLLYSNYFLKSRGIKVLYMGNDVTAENIASILQVNTVSYLFTYVPQHFSFPNEHLLNYIATYAPNCKLVIAGYYTEEKSIEDKKILRMDFTKALDYIQASLL